MTSKPSESSKKTKAPARSKPSQPGNTSSTPGSSGSCKASTDGEQAGLSTLESSMIQGVIQGKFLITPANYRSLKAEYDAAVTTKAPEFIWRDMVFVTDFAKYALEHMRNVLGIKE